LAETKRKRADKKQKGQFMTPLELARRLVDTLSFTETSKILEPSFGDGSFLQAIVDKLLTLGNGDKGTRLKRIFEMQLYGVELDDGLYQKAIATLEEKYNVKLNKHNLQQGDFFRQPIANNQFDFIIGNPPFGGTLDADIEDPLDKAYGRWGEHKIKKETYSFFIARSLDLLKTNGTLRFISSDTFLTISTMIGLRKRLMDQCHNSLQNLSYFSDETNYPMLVLTAEKSGQSAALVVDGTEISRSDMLLTDNFSWKLDPELIKYFRGDKLSKYIICTSGMTVGKNEYFIRELDENGGFMEPYDFSFFDKSITLKEEISKARLGKISAAKREEIKRKELLGETYRALNVRKLDVPIQKIFPNKDYLPYNKANNSILYSEPKNIVYWKDEGDAVMTYKKTGNWYLNGVGGGKFFKQEGLTWQLISSRINMKYLPAGYILDSGAPCAFLRDGVDKTELWFILGWTLTDLATQILKTTVNHTKNIQGKDIERLPYPWWISDNIKSEISQTVEKMVRQAIAGKTFTRQDKVIQRLNNVFAMDEDIRLTMTQTEERTSESIDLPIFTLLGHDVGFDYVLAQN
jgi:hypothetical protein